MASKRRWRDITDSTHWSESRNEDVALRANKQLSPLTAGQARYIRMLREKAVVLCTGPAGSGKTYVPTVLAAEALQAGRTGGVVLVRPLVTCGEGLGWLPGTLEEKVLPYMRPLLDALEGRLTPEQTRDKVRFWPLETMRGATLRDCWVVADEVQNATYHQLHMLLTRLGQGCKMVLAGDASQTDLPGRLGNPFLDVIARLCGRESHPDVGLVELTADDIVRSGIVRWLDERLGPRRATPHWLTIPCPACRHDCYFDEGQSGWVDLVRCWHCRASIHVPDDLEDLGAIRVVESTAPATPTYERAWPAPLAAS